MAEKIGLNPIPAGFDTQMGHQIKIIQESCHKEHEGVAPMVELRCEEPRKVSVRL